MFKLFRSVKDEILIPLEGEVIGVLPSWINGSVYRNGPGLFEFGNTQYFHWFDGMAILQRFNIHDGRVTYQRRFLESETFQANMAANRITMSEFGTRSYPDPNKNPFSQLLSKLIESMSDNCPVNILKIGKELFAVSQTKFLHRFDPNTLETMERVNLCDIVDVKQASANAHYDQTGKIHNIGYRYGATQPKYCFFTLEPTNCGNGSKYKAELISALEIEHAMHPSYIHSFFMTENYYIFMEQPLVINAWKIASADIRKLAMSDCLEWRKDFKVRFHVINRKTGTEMNAMFEYEALPCMVVSQGNAYEIDGHIVLDMPVFRDRTVLDSYLMSNLTFTSPESEGNFPPSSYQRYILPLDIDKKIGANLVSLESTSALAIRITETTICLTPDVLSNVSFDLPVINYEYCGREYRYVYGVTYDCVPKFTSCLIKLNVQMKSHLLWQEENCFPSQPMFVAAPDAESEDDGVLLATVNSTDDNKPCYLLFLNAKTMTEVCRVTFPVWIPRDLQGLFTSEH